MRWLIYMQSPAGRKASRRRAGNLHLRKRDEDTDVRYGRPRHTCCRLIGQLPAEMPRAAHVKPTPPRFIDARRDASLRITPKAPLLLQFPTGQPSRLSMTISLRLNSGGLVPTMHNLFVIHQFRSQFVFQLPREGLLRCLQIGCGVLTRG